MNDERKRLKNAIEAIIFACGEPIELQKIALAEAIDLDSAAELTEELRADYVQRGGGVVLRKLEDRYQFTTEPAYEEDIRKVLDVKRNQPLSSAAFEVLAVVAYNQPVTKAFIEQVRGVDCSGVIGTLSQRGLIEECGRLDLPGRPLLYCTTVDFLRCFCLSSLDELPALPANGDAAAALADVSNDPNILNGQISIL